MKRYFFLFLTINWQLHSTYLFFLKSVFLNIVYITHFENVLKIHKHFLVFFKNICAITISLHISPCSYVWSFLFLFVNICLKLELMNSKVLDFNFFGYYEVIASIYTTHQQYMKILIFWNCQTLLPIGIVISISGN